MDIFEADDNSTPLTAEEKDGLKLKWITLLWQILFWKNLKEQNFTGETQTL